MTVKFYEVRNGWSIEDEEGFIFRVKILNGGWICEHYESGATVYFTIYNKSTHEEYFYNTLNEAMESYRLRRMGFEAL